MNNCQKLIAVGKGSLWHDVVVRSIPIYSLVHNGSPTSAAAAAESFKKQIICGKALSAAAFILSSSHGLIPLL